MTENNRPVEDLSFREAMQELESIVGLLEANALELEESLVVYERGVSLLRSLKCRLGAAEQRIEVLMGELSEMPSDASRDATLS